MSDHQLSFVKYSGCGNDFILVDSRIISWVDQLSSEQKSLLCQRQQGIGADGIIFLQNSSSADFRMRIFNVDGSEAEMCGNGIRCLARFIEDLGISKDEITIETMHSLIKVKCTQNAVQVKMPAPNALCKETSLILPECSLKAYWVDTGVPHAVLFVDDLENDLHMRLAPAIRHHSEFGPRGTNVNFANLRNSRQLVVRTYERGVEQETLACGTGAVATALAAAYHYGLKSPLAIETRSGDILHIDFAEGVICPAIIEMTGPARKVFAGTMDLNGVVT